MPRQYNMYSTHLSECWKERIAKETKYNANIPVASWELEPDLSSELSAVSRASGTTRSSHMSKSAISTSTLASSVAVTKASCPDYALALRFWSLPCPPSSPPFFSLPPSLCSLPLLTVATCAPTHILAIVYPQIAELEEKLRRENEKRQKVEAKLKSLSEADESSAS